MDRIKTSVSRMKVDFSEKYFSEHCILLLTARKGTAGKKQEILGKTLAALEPLREQYMPFAASVVSSGSVCVISDKADEGAVREALKDEPVSVMRVCSTAYIGKDTLCDLSVKYGLSRTLGAFDILPKKKGVSYLSKNGKMVITVCFAPDGEYVTVSAYGKNIKKASKKEDKRFLFTFSAEGLLVYSKGKDDTRKKYAWRERKDDGMTKADVIHFVAEKDYEGSDNKILRIMQVINILRNTEGVTAEYEIWTGERYPFRIGENGKALKKACSAAAKAMETGGIRIQEEGSFPFGKEDLKRGFDLVFAAEYRARIRGNKEKTSKIKVDDERVLALKAGTTVLYPESRGKGYTVFDIRNRTVSSVTAFIYGNGLALTAGLYDESGKPWLNIPLKQEGKDTCLAASPVREDGKYTVKVIKDLEAPYDKDLSVQHITAGTIGDNVKNMGPVCENIMFQLMIKDDIKNGTVTLSDISGYRGYTFILSEDETLYSMDVLENGKCRWARAGINDRLALLPYMPENKTEKLMAVKRPDGSYLVITDTHLVPVPGESFSPKDFTRAGKSSNENLAPFLDFVWYEKDGSYYYTAGWDLIKKNGEKYKYFPKIRKIVATEGKVDRDMFFALLDVPFVWMAQKNTVIPYPYKYLREYISVEKSIDEKNE